MSDTLAKPLRKKLIEISIPLEAINAASAREKSIRHGHPSTLHLWWARRPLAACRAVLFAQLVDDPSSWPEKFPTEAEQDAERRRLHRVIEKMVPWEASNDERILNEARWEIARSVAWGLGEEPPPKEDAKAIIDYLQTKAPPVYDPFSGGGSIPLEAQRLGLRAYGSDLNPVAVLIGKALVEIPPKFAGLPPVNPKSRAELARGGKWNAKGAQGLAEDVRYYGQWMRDEAEKRIGHFYPKAKLPDGSEATVIAWLWARTVRSPDPAAKGAMVPLVSTFMLSTKEGKKAWVEPVIDRSAPNGWSFLTKSGEISRDEEERLKKGTKTGRGNFVCILTGAPITETWIRSEGKEKRLGERLMAIVVEADRGRKYLSPMERHEIIAAQAVPEWHPEGKLYEKALGFRVPAYGLTNWADLFSPRQQLGLTTFSDLVCVTRDKIIADSDKSKKSEEEIYDYANSIAIYLAFTISRVADLMNNLCQWRNDPAKQHVGHLFSRQAIPMTWDFAEANLFGSSAGSWTKCADFVPKVIEMLPCISPGMIENKKAQDVNSFAIYSTDPPYFDNVAYADLSDFFYLWLRYSLSHIIPNLFRRLSTPKDDELVATPGRHGGKEGAEKFFMDGMNAALSAMFKVATDDQPLAIFYAFKQSELASEGITSAGWSSFLQAVTDSEFVVDGTWPVRTELANRMRGKDSNALASSIVLVCRKRASSASTITRADFVRDLRKELPQAIKNIRKAGVGPVDMQQSVIGPGMGVFSRHAKVLEDDDSAMTVKTALALINRVWEEIDQELDAAFDSETQVALAWFSTYGFDARTSGELIVLANAKIISVDALFASGVFKNLRGRAALTPREELPKDWTPSTDKTLTIWECVQHTARVLNAEDGGGPAAALLVAEMGSRGADARALAYRLFEIATQKGWAAEALIYNELAQEWPKLEDLASSSAAPKTTISAQAEMF